MKLYTVNAFTLNGGGGNPAGVAVPDDLFAPMPPESDMKAAAARLGYSETVFMQRTDAGLKLRYFTPVAEVELCGHATIACFSLLRQLGIAAAGEHIMISTVSGELNVDIESDIVWMDMAAPKYKGVIPESGLTELYSSLGSPVPDMPLMPAIVDTGLPDIMLPVCGKAALDSLMPDLPAISRLSERYNVTGIHAFSLDDTCTCRCRNFAPLYGIDEECATGTSNGALTHYLALCGLISDNKRNMFIQGEAMGRPSAVFSVKNDGLIRVGGHGTVIKQLD